ncbi:MAG: hypothetical protein R3C40_12030 [Parvularculaceae bacterium]
MAAVRPLHRNMNASYLHTKIGAFSTIDVRNPTAGRTDVDLIADVVLGQNCVITRGATDPSLIGASLPGGLAALNPLFASNYSVCSQINGPNALLGLTHWRPSTSILAPITAFAAGDQSIEGNRLLGSPEFKIAGGVQYEMPLGASHTLTPRVDAYYQSNMYANNFNTQQDLIDGYAYLNAQITLRRRTANWAFRFFMQNSPTAMRSPALMTRARRRATSRTLYFWPRRWGVGPNMSF